MSLYALPGFIPGLAAFADKDTMRRALPTTKKEQDDKLDVAIKEVKIDNAILIQSLTDAPSKKKTPARSKCRLRRRMFESPKEEKASQSTTDSDNDGPSEDAMKFELSIACGEKSYTVVRSLPAFRGLRHDLVKEVGALEKIPELPCWREQARGVVGWTFSLLDALMRSYVPVLDRWIHTVTDLVPSDSPTLKDFFGRKPLDFARCARLEEELMMKAISKHALEAIHETGFSDDDADVPCRPEGPDGDCGPPEDGGCF